MDVFRIVNSVFNSNSYILSQDSEKHCWLVDCGDVEPILEWLNTNKKDLVGVFITHSHFDHIYGLNKISTQYPNCIIYISKKGKEGLYSDTLNISRYNLLSLVYNFDNVTTLNDRDKVTLFPNCFMEAYLTLGHDWSCMTYCCDKNIFTGDSYLLDFGIITGMPKSDKSLATQSLGLILNLIATGEKYVFPGHGSVGKSLNGHPLGLSY